MYVPIGWINPAYHPPYHSPRVGVGVGGWHYLYCIFYCSVPQNEACPLSVNLTCNGGGNVVSFDAIEFVTWISCWNQLVVPYSKSKCWELSLRHVSCPGTVFLVLGLRGQV